MGWNFALKVYKLLIKFNLGALFESKISKTYGKFWRLAMVAGITLKLIYFCQFFVDVVRIKLASAQK